jgi:hypothetical protein
MVKLFFAFVLSYLIIAPAPNIASVKFSVLGYSLIVSKFGIDLIKTGER